MKKIVLAGEYYHMDKFKSLLQQLDSKIDHIDTQLAHNNQGHCFKPFWNQRQYWFYCFNAQVLTHSAGEDVKSAFLLQPLNLINFIGNGTKIVRLYRKFNKTESNIKIQIKESENDKDKGPMSFPGF